MHTNNFLKNIFVIHVSEGYEERRKHIDSHLPHRGLDKFSYILDGDIKALSADILSKHFIDQRPSATNSCFYKHYLAYKEMVDNKISCALILEDDVFLKKSALKKLKQVINELHKNKESNYLVNIERASSAVPFIIRKSNKYLYRASKTKLAGGYIIDLALAISFVDYIDNHPVALPIDTFHSKMKNTLQYNIFWMEPAVVKQGSKMGVFDSPLSGRKKGFYGGVRAIFKDFYKAYLLDNIRPTSYQIFKNTPKK